MLGARYRPRPRSALLLTVAVGLLAAACQGAMSIEEAKDITLAFGGGFVAPPRTINDVTAILEHHRFVSCPVAYVRGADPPGMTSQDALAEFYFQRGIAARDSGCIAQEIGELTTALEHARAGFTPLYRLLYHLGFAELTGGNATRSIEYLREAVNTLPSNAIDWRVKVNAVLAAIYAEWGGLNAADSAVGEIADAVNVPLQWNIYTPDPTWTAQRHATFAAAQAASLEAKGRYAEAAALYRRSVSMVESVSPRDATLDFRYASLSRTLVRQGRLVEAESEARKALLGALSRRGRYSAHTAFVLQTLILVLLEQGRYPEAEKLARAAIDIYERVRAAPDSLLFARARAQLAAALEFQGRDSEALAEYEASRAALGGDAESLQKLFDGHVGYATVLLRAGRADRALGILRVALDGSTGLVWETHRSVGEIRGILAQAYAAQGQTVRALREFDQATRLLLRRSADVGDEAAGPRSVDHRVFGILSAYIGLLADIKGTPLEREAGLDATAEAFRLADIARGRSVQRSLNASAVRSAANSPELSDIVRGRQDARQQIHALYEALANVLSRPSGQQDQRVIADIRRMIESLRRAVNTLTSQIESKFPAYAELIDPKPLTLRQAHTNLQSGEALIATLTTRERTFVWAVAENGSVAFTTAPIGAREMEKTVAELRKALEPRAKTLGEIPEFDVTLAHAIYSSLLEPVRPAWEQAKNLLVVTHGALGQLPLAVLPTQSAPFPRDSGQKFMGYRRVPWLIRSHAVTVLPSVASLATIRAFPAGDPSRRAFVGFGDPYFNQEQAIDAARSMGATAAAAPRRGQDVEFVQRGTPIAFRSSPQAFDSARLAKLPRLPDTGEEIRSLAQVLDADLSTDVFVGARANEAAVKTARLANYRVVAFATHGLVPGDLDGLAQPALALSAPEVADIAGDGLLAMDEIMGLRLDADWVVLSACNTASGRGSGFEALTGLGRAFFYAGARSLLVSNWPVESTSAHRLTTSLFRRQREIGVGRAEALQWAMNWLIDNGEFVDAESGKAVFSYAHPIFWAPFTLIGDGG
jgi:CHAT domain-containing protein